MEKTPIRKIDKIPLIEEPTLPLASQLSEIQQTIIAQDLGRVPTENVISLPGMESVSRAEFIPKTSTVEGKRIPLDISTQRMTEGMLLPEPKEPFWPMAAYGLASALGTALTLRSDPYIAAGIGQGFGEGIKRWTDIQSQREELKQKKKYQDLQISLDQLRLDMEERKLKQQEEEADREAAIQAWTLGQFLPQEVPVQATLPFPTPTGTGVLPPATYRGTRLETPEERAKRLRDLGLSVTVSGVTLKAPEEEEVKYTLEDALKERDIVQKLFPDDKVVVEKTATGYTVSVKGEPEAIADVKLFRTLYPNVDPGTEQGRKLFYEHKQRLVRAEARPQPTDKGLTAGQQETLKRQKEATKAYIMRFLIPVLDKAPTFDTEGRLLMATNYRAPASLEEFLYAVYPGNIVPAEHPELRDLAIKIWKEKTTPPPATTGPPAVKQKPREEVLKEILE